MWLSTVSLLLFLTHFTNGKLSPIVFVPGAGASRLYAKWYKPVTNSPFYCDRYEGKFYQLWPSIEVSVPIAVDCWVDNIRLLFNETTGETSNTPGVETKFPGFGNTMFMEYLADFHLDSTRYLADFVEGMSKIGYQPGKNLRGAPYDFRKSPHENERYMDNLEALIEHTYVINDNQPATLIAHSLGGLYALYFLHRQDQAWKDKYIKSFVSVGTPFIGALTSVQAYINGYNFNLTVFPTLKLRTVQRTWLSTATMLPGEKLWPSDPIVVTPMRNYTSRDYKQLFDDIGYPLGYKMYLESRGRAKPEIPPNVKVFCMAATELDTPQAYVYGAKNFPDVPPIKDISFDGDATVPSYSANFCLKWTRRQNFSVDYQEFPKVAHISLISDPNAIAYMKTILMT